MTTFDAVSASWPPSAGHLVSPGSAPRRGIGLWDIPGPLACRPPSVSCAVDALTVPEGPHLTQPQEARCASSNDQMTPPAIRPPTGIVHGSRGEGARRIVAIVLPSWGNPHFVKQCEAWVSPTRAGDGAAGQPPLTSWMPCVLRSPCLAPSSLFTNYKEKISRVVWVDRSPDVAVRASLRPQSCNDSVDRPCAQLVESFV